MPTYDSKCHELAGDFLADYPRLRGDAKALADAQDKLAAAIQREIEGWLSDHRELTGGTGQ